MNPSTHSRRTILRAAASLGVLGTLGATAHANPAARSKINLKKGALIERSQKEIPGVQIVICEPCTTRTSEDFKVLADYGKVARKLAEEMKLLFVPFQSLFDEASKAAPAEFWLWDGIHPTVAGHAIMAAKWREVVGI
jgi:lysophospholipase L1-like esterase